MKETINIHDYKWYKVGMVVDMNFGEPNVETYQIIKIKKGSKEDIIDIIKRKFQINEFRYWHENIETRDLYTKLQLDENYEFLYFEEEYPTVLRIKVLTKKTEEKIIRERLELMHFKLSCGLYPLFHYLKFWWNKKENDVFKLPLLYKPKT